MTAPRDPMFQTLEHIGGADKWRKELAGAPTYLAAAMLSWRYSEWSIIGSFLILVCFLVMYHYVYEFVFPKFDSRKKGGRLLIFVVAQLAFWVSAFVLWFYILHRAP